MYLDALLEKITGSKAARWTVPDCGLSAAHRFSVTLENGGRVFVKAATDDVTEHWLRNEYKVLSEVKAPCMPRVIEWIDGPGPVLFCEDLSDAYWPASHAGVTWREGDIGLLLEAVKDIAAYDAPDGLLALKNPESAAWSAIAANPAGFLQLGVCSEKWFAQVAGALINAELKTDVTGNSLVHGDVRSDNICISGQRVMFVDWSDSVRGNARHDLASLLPTLHLEGGPAPFSIMPDGGGEAAMHCAGLVQRLLADNTMPGWLKSVFKRLVAIELAWAAESLGLEKP